MRSRWRGNGFVTHSYFTHNSLLHLISFNCWQGLIERIEALPAPATKRRQIAKNVMVEHGLNKMTASDFSASLRRGMGMGFSAK
jgi:hypothetical protein